MKFVFIKKDCYNMFIENHVDAVIGLQYGDEGKGKIVQAMLTHEDYDVCARFNGGPNAGHTLILPDGTKRVHHQLPVSALFDNVKSYIGPGTVLDWGRLEDEIEHNRTNYLNRLYIAPNVPLISNQNKENDTYKGSTKRGIAPAYADFYGRKSALTKDLTLQDSSGREVIQTIESCETMLLEGAQGYYLDPWHGAYPWTSSSLISPAAAAATFGFESKKLRKIYGVAKPYETAVGYHPKFDIHKSESFFSLAKAGNEFGATTGRPRQVQYLNLDRLIIALNKTTTTHLIFNKCDVFEEISDFSYVFQNQICTFNSFKDFREELIELLFNYAYTLKHIQWFSSPLPQKVY